MEDLDFGEAAANTVPTTAFDSIEKLNSSCDELRDFPFSLGDVVQTARAYRSFPRSYLSKIKKIRADTAEYRERYILPNIDEIEKKSAADPSYFPTEIINAGTRYRFPSLIIPEGFGGPGYMVLHVAVMAEELAVGSGGFSTTITVNMAQLVSFFDLHLFAVYSHETLQAEKRGETIVWSGAVTEPDAGTDRWDFDFQNATRAGMVAKKVEGGYVLNGSKCFISNGSASSRAAVTAALDPADPQNTTCFFVLDTATPGFSVGRVERKLGQKASVTSEQVFEDVFVPDSHMLLVDGVAARGTTLYLAASRGPVGAIGVGCGRRALESLIEWASERRDGAGRLIDQQALQVKIANMARELAVARAAYVEACVAFDQVITRLLSPWYMRVILRLTPSRLMRTEAFRRVVQSKAARRKLYEVIERAFPDDRMMYIAGLAANAKVLGSCAGRKVAGEVMEIMGPDAADPRWGVDRAYRDARLTEIYEGTNQACAITSFKAIAGSLVETCGAAGRG